MSMKRLAPLDAARFVAATAVTFYHVTAERGLERAQTVTRFGWLGVPLFFLISGFVILWSASGRTPATFARARAKRLYPTLWLSVLLTALVVTILGEHVTATEVVANLTMVPNLIGVPYVDGVYWTLFVELKFYILVFVVLAAGQMHRIQPILTAWLVVLGYATFWHVPHWVESLTLAPYGIYFVGGSFAYLLARPGDHSRTWPIAAILAAAVLGEVATLKLAPGFQPMQSIQETAVILIVVGAVYGFFLLLALDRIPQPRRPQIWVALGSLTYPLYLVHNRIGKALWAGVTFSPWLAWICILITVYALAAGVTWCIERRPVPILRYLRITS